MSTLRVGLVCGYFDPRRDGVADYSRHLARELPTTGVQPIICTSYSCAEYSDVNAVGVTDAWTVRGVRRAARELTRLSLDLVHVQFAPSAFGFSRAVGLLPHFVDGGTPLITTLHEYGKWQPRSMRGLRSAAWGAVERSEYADRDTLLLGLRSARLLVTAPEHSELFDGRFPRRRGATQYVPIGPNIPILDVDREANRRSVRAWLGLAPKTPVVVFFGFLHQEKGLGDLIAAVAAVRRYVSGVQLVIAGGGESHSVLAATATGLRRQLDRAADRSRIASHVTFTGYQPEEQISRLLHAADAAVFPFTTGVSAKSSSLLAALAHGVPTIATAQTPRRRGLSDGILEVPPRDSATLAQALRHVLCDRALANRLSEAARTRAATHTWPAIAATHARIYAEVLGCADRASGDADACPAASVELHAAGGR